MMHEDADREVLEQRARALARPRDEQHALSEDGNALALFERDGTVYGIARSAVFEVARVLAPTPLPRSALYWLGVTSLHGELLALFDLPVLLGGMPAPSGAVRSIDDENVDEAADRKLVLVLGTGRRELAVLVDAVREPRAVREQLAAAPDPEHGGSRIVLGTTDDGVRVLDARALLKDPRLRIEPDNPSET